MDKNSFFFSFWTLSDELDAWIAWIEHSESLDSLKGVCHESLDSLKGVCHKSLDSLKGVCHESLDSLKGVCHKVFGHFFMIGPW